MKRNQLHSHHGHQRPSGLPRLRWRKRAWGLLGGRCLEARFYVHEYNSCAKHEYILDENTTPTPIRMKEYTILRVKTKISMSITEFVTKQVQFIKGLSKTTGVSVQSDELRSQEFILFQNSGVVCLSRRFRYLSRLF